MEHSLLTNALVYLGAAVLAVPLAKRLGLGAVLGYLLAGMAIGPWGLGLIREVETILHFSEFGVVLLLFLIGLELEPARLWSMRRPIFGWGAAQVLGVAGVLFGAALLAGVAWQVALVGRARAVAVLDRDRAGHAGRTQPDGHARRPGRLRHPAVPGHRRDPDDRPDPLAGRGGGQRRGQRRLARAPRALAA